MTDMPPTIQDRYFLSKFPVELGSEKIFLDDSQLLANVDYTVNHKYGIINFLIPLKEGVELKC